MRARERGMAQKKLDKELRYYRLAYKDDPMPDSYLRLMRQVLHVPVAELAKELGVSRSVLFRLEQSEGRGTISLNRMYDVAQKMNCRFVYAVVPRHGWTLAELAEWRRLRKAAGETTAEEEPGTQKRE